MTSLTYLSDTSEASENEDQDEETLLERIMPSMKQLGVIELDNEKSPFNN